MPKNNDVNRLLDWGLSMYGGYYVNYWSADERKWTGFGADTYRELKAEAERLGMKLEKCRREDH